MRKIVLVLWLLGMTFTLSAQTNGTLSWAYPSPTTPTNFSVSLFKTDTITTPLPWPLFLRTNNPATNKINVNFVSPAGFFYGNYAQTNYAVLTNATVSSNVVVSPIVTTSTNKLFNTITLAWDPSADPSVVGYKVYEGSASRNYTNSMSAGSATTFTISAPAKVPYYFAATAYDTNGIESDYSTEVMTNNFVVLSTTNYTTNIVYSTNYTYTTNSSTMLTNLALKLEINVPFKVQTNTYSYTNLAGITIRDNTTSTPYPSSITVSNVTGMVDKVTVILRGVAQTYLSDIDLMMSGPSNQTVILMSDVGANTSTTGLDFIFDDAAATSLWSNSIPTITNGTYRVSNFSESWRLTDTWPAPAPAQNITNKLSVFTSKNPNGVWSVWSVDDGPNDFGSIRSWELNIRVVNFNTNAPSGTRIGKRVKVELPPLPQIKTLKYGKEKAGTRTH
jgi:subtilisin-like proprotein convertase family protein